MTRPAAYPFWTDGNPAKVTTPDGASALQGFVAGEPPPFQYVNYLFYTINAWIEYLDQITNTGLNNALIRLINGGNWAFNAQTGVLSWSATANLAIPSLPDSANAFAAGSVTLNDGDVAYLTANMPTQSLGDTNPSLYPDEIVNMNFTGNISVGDVVTGPGIPNGTTVLGVAASSVLLSQNTTSTNTQENYVFASAGSLSVQTSANTALEPTPQTILLARRAGAVVYLGVNCAQMVLRDGEFKTLIGSGYFSLYQAPAGQNLTAGQLVYISPGSGDGGRTAGAVYPLDVSAANEAMRGTYAGVVISPVSTSQTAQILFSGFFAESGLMAGSVYYADPATPGGITVNAPMAAGSKVLPVAFAVTSSDILFIGAQISSGGSGFPIFAEDTFAGNGTQTAFTLSSAPAAANSVFPFVDGTIIPNTLWSLGGSTVTFTSAPTGQVTFRYILASQSFLAGNQGAPTNPSSDRQTYVLPFIPANQESTFVYVNGILVPTSQWELTVGLSGAQVFFPSPLGIGQQVYVTTFSAAASPSSGGGGGGSITGGDNVGSGVGIFDDVAGSLLQFFSLVAGSGVTIAYDGVGGIVISASGGGSAREVHGSAVSPIAIDPTVGITPTSANDQVWWISLSSGSDGVKISSTPAIGPGTIGQRLTLKSVPSPNYLIIPSGTGSGATAGAGTDQNGDCSMGPVAQAITYSHDGTNWSEDSRRV